MGKETQPSDHQKGIIYERVKMRGGFKQPHIIMSGEPPRETADETTIQALLEQINAAGKPNKWYKRRRY